MGQRHHPGRHNRGRGHLERGVRQTVGGGIGLTFCSLSA